MRKILSVSLLVLTGLLLASCDSDFDADSFQIPESPAPTPAPPEPTAFNVITGVAAKGLIADGAVSLIDADGTDLDVTTTTADDGSFSLDLPPALVDAGVSTPLQVVITSDGTATMVCDADLDAAGDSDCLVGKAEDGSSIYAAFGETFTLSSDFVIRSVVDSLPAPTDDGASVTVNVTPLTELATALALGTGVTLTEEQVTNATAQVKALVETITGTDLGELPLTEIPVVNLADIEAAAAASEAALAAASFSASIFARVVANDEVSDTIAEALAAFSAAVVDRVQATGNPSAFPPGLLASLTAGSADLLNAVAARISDAGLDSAFFSSIISAVTELSNILAQVPDDIDVVIAPGAGGIDLGDFEIPDPTDPVDPSDGSPPGDTVPAEVNQQLVGDYTLVYADLSADNDQDPFSDGQTVTASVGADGSLTIDGKTLTDPYFRQSGGTTLTVEVTWFDAEANIEYALSNNDSGTFNEINVGESGAGSGGFPAFLGQLTGTVDGGSGGSVTAPCGDNDGGAVTGVQLVANCAGTYNVTDASAGFHPTGQIFIDTTGRVDFDGTNVFTAGQIVAVFDRLFIDDEPRIQINYGADDDGPVIQIFFTPGTTTVERISYRNRSAGEENIADVVLLQGSEPGGSGGDSGGGGSSVFEIIDGQLPPGDFTLTISGTISVTNPVPLTTPVPDLVFEDTLAPSPEDTADIEALVLATFADVESVTNVSVNIITNTADRVTFEISADAEQTQAGTTVSVSLDLRYDYVRG